MRGDSLAPLFRPRSVAVVGASQEPSKLGHVLLKNVVEGGFRGEIYPVNPAGGTILGRTVYRDLGEIPGAPDLVLISVPNRVVPAVIAEAARRGSRAAVILASGFGEMGGAGAALQKRILQARREGMRILGPNCMGIFSHAGALNGTYFWKLCATGPGVAFVSQSGAYGGMLFGELRRRSIPLAAFASMGNQADLSHADVLEALAGEKSVRLVALLIEQVREGPRFLRACRTLARRVPVVTLKVGRTTAGRRAALSHTGSLAGDYEVYVAALAQAGAVVARDTENFFDSIAALHAYPNGAPRNAGLGIVTISGGPCVAAADACEAAGIAVPPLSTRTQSAVRALIPEFGASSNPVDMTPQMAPDRYAACVRTVAADPAIGGLLAVNVGLDRPQFAEAFVGGKRPVVAFVADVPAVESGFAKSGIPIFSSPERAVGAFGAMRVRSAARERARRAWDSATPARVRKDLPSLSDYGIPQCRMHEVRTVAQAIAAAENLGYPVAVKAAVAHKSDRDGVVLNVKDREDLVAVASRLRTRFPRLLVQEMVRGDHELLIGGRRDPVFGPVVAFGSGGIWAEQTKDVAFRVCPLDAREARAMIEETQAGRRLGGGRGVAPVDLNVIVRILRAVSRLLSEHPSVTEIDLNPVIVSGRRAVAVDALIADC